MGPTCAVYARCMLTDNHLLQIDTLLGKLAGTINRTRKSRIWDAWIENRHFHVCVEITDDVLWDCEDELLKLDMLPDDAPFRISLSAGVTGRKDYDMLRHLAYQIAPLVNGIPTEPEK